MGLLLDSFWRAVAYCLHPRVIALSVLPLLLMIAAAFGLGLLLLGCGARRGAPDARRLAGDGHRRGWLESAGVPGVKAALAPLVVVLLATPLIVVVALLVVALMMAPSMLSLVTERR